MPISGFPVLMPHSSILGKLALPEFKAAVKGSSSGSQLNDMQLEAMFNFYDEEKTGFVSFESMRCPLSQICFWLSCSG